MAILCIMLSVVCLTDYRRTRIPNGMILLMILYGAGYRYWDAGGQGVLQFFENCILVLLLSYPLFKIGTIGAGDIKLVSVVCGYLSKQETACFLVFSLLISAIFSIIKLYLDGNVRERFVYFCSYIAGVYRTGRWQLYFSEKDQRRRSGICLSGPIFISMLLHAGGVY